MVSASVPGMQGWGNLYYPSLSGAHGPSPCHGGGLRALFLFGCRVAGMADHMRGGWAKNPNIVQDNSVHDNNHGIVVGIGCPAEGGAQVRGRVAQASCPARGPVIKGTATVGEYPSSSRSTSIDR